MDREAVRGIGERKGTTGGSNRLAGENSPYLLQHADNPVDWYPWSAEAFEKARREGKPVFLSIGYSTCHWCHVMERESFENISIAEVLNERYVSIKVDREERPDIDETYMNTVTAMTGSGGWPLSVFLTPEGEAFFGGTYFPPEDRYGRPGFRKILVELADAWDAGKSEVVRLARRISGELDVDESDNNRRSLLSSRLMEDAFKGLESVYDPVNGGFGVAPKFPRPAYLSLLLRYWYRTGSGKAMEMLRKSLDHMAAGGIRDHAGGGFHRYSTDESWLVPHFEKMLYDQALLSRIYAEAFVATGEPFYEKVSRSVLDYVIRDMTAPEGGYMSAEDADSRGMEGGFYLWTRREIEGLPDAEDAEGLMETYGVTEEGNFERGYSILNMNGVRGEGREERSAVLMREELRTGADMSVLAGHRDRRERPFLDDKVIAAWNGLMISAMATAGTAFGEGRYIDSAIHAAAFVRSSMHGGGKLRRYFRDGRAQGRGFLDDHAFLAAGLIDLYQATSDREYLSWAEELAESMIMDFADDTRGGFFLSAADLEVKPGGSSTRSRPYHDGEVPSGNSAAAGVMLSLGTLLEKEHYIELASGTVQAFSGKLSSVPSSAPVMLGILEDIEGPSGEGPTLGCTGIFCKKI